jgi:phytoene dehydrogenase-like protein
MPADSNGYDAVIVGSGPNGLASAITLAKAGRSMLVLEAKDRIGGGCRSSELTLPGFIHDDCSAIHPLAVSSPFFRSLPLAEYGLSWIYPPAAVAHPLDDGTAVLVERSFQATGETLGPDKVRYCRLIDPLAANWEKIIYQVLGPLRIPRYPIAFARFGQNAVLPAFSFARKAFQGERARAVFAGMSAHSMMPLEWPLTAGFGLLMSMLCHTVGWPMARGGSQKISDTLAGYLGSLGGEIITNHPVVDIYDLPVSKSVLLDITPRRILQITGSHFPSGYRRALERYRYGPGVYKIDLALDGPIPWKSTNCGRAATVHLGGTLEEIAAAERSVWNGEHAEYPFVILVQQSLFDPSRAPQGKHTGWAYCHVPNGSTQDVSEQILSQIERFAPGFRNRILEISKRSALEMQTYNPNYVGGDINGGVQDLYQFYTRPVPRLVPYTTPANNIYICSSSTPPGGGVHGMCGYYAAQAVLRKK